MYDNNNNVHRFGNMAKTKDDGSSTSSKHLQFCKVHMHRLWASVQPILWLLNMNGAHIHIRYDIWYTLNYPIVTMHTAVCQRVRWSIIITAHQLRKHASFWGWALYLIAMWENAYMQASFIYYASFYIFIITTSQSWIWAGPENRNEYNIIVIIMFIFRHKDIYLFIYLFICLILMMWLTFIYFDSLSVNAFYNFLSARLILLRNFWLSICIQ